MVLPTNPLHVSKSARLKLTGKSKRPGSYLSNSVPNIQPGCQCLAYGFRTFAPGLFHPRDLWKERCL